MTDTSLVWNRWCCGLAAATWFGLALTPTAAAADPRIVAPAPSAYDAEQREAAQAFMAARQRAPFGPFEPMLHSPRVMTAARATGDYLRYGPAIGVALSEMVILIAAREWDQDYEWSLHAPIALQRGIPASVVDSIARGRRPDGMSLEQAICYDFTTQLLRNRTVSDATLAAAKTRFGDKGVVDLTAIAGYYALLAMQLNVAQTPPDAGGPTLPALERSGRFEEAPE